MKTGTIISGAAHGLLLLLALFDAPWGASEPQEDVQVTQVSLLSIAEFEAATTSVTPASEEIATPEVSEADNPMTAEPDEPETPDPVIAINSDNTTVLGSGEDGNSVDEAESTDTARDAPRVADVAVVAVEDTKEGEVVIEETTPDETPAEPVEEEQAETPTETITEIIPEAKPDATPTAAPVIASMPILRPPAKPDAATDIDIDLAVQEAEEDAIRDLLAQALEEEIVEEVADEPPAALPVTLTASQQRSIGTAVSQHWNKSIVLGKADFERLVVRVSVLVAADGRIISDVTPVEPANPTGDFQVAFDAARRAVMRADVIPLPAGQFPNGVKLILRFDPVLGIGLN